MSNVTKGGRRQVGKIVGSIAVVGTAAAVAGLGTFGGFTDSTSAVDANASTGVLSIDVSAAGSSAPVPYTSANLLPGDAGSIPVDLRNGGDVDLSSLVMKSRATASSALDTDTVNGLQLQVQSCGTAWTGSYLAPTCTGGATELYRGPIVVEKSLTGARSMQAGATDHLLVTVSFPAGAGNELKNQTSSFEFVFTGAQRDGGPR